MSKKTDKKFKTLNKGFTLVELIVVLLVLAVLAAVLIPALMGYIDKARESKYYINARSCMDAAQSELVELYAKNGGNTKPGDNVISGATITTTKNGDCDITTSTFKNKVLKLAEMEGDREPYCFMIAVGSNNVNSQAGSYKVSEHDKYTVFYAFYMETEDATPLYYYNGEWTKTNPRATGTTEVFSEYNVVKSGMLKGKRLQYYLISNQTGKGSIDGSTLWNWLKSMK